MSKKWQNPPHKPVLVNEVLRYLDPKPGQSYLDLTAGYGGHAAAILLKTKAEAKAILVDRDPEAVRQLKEHFGTKAKLINNDYLGVSQQLQQEGRQFDLILADLGVSSLQLDQPQRGFTFSKAGPLDMRMDTGQETTAASLLQEWDEAELADVLKRYGEEPAAKKIAAAIIANRPYSDTKQLAEVIESAGRRFGHSRTHPATKVFQAIRIAVNQELDQLEKSLPIWVDLLSDGGRLAVISFHSLEDRIVKRFFADKAAGQYDSELSILTKKPVTATRDEIVSNPRARSANLRVAVKINTKGRKD